LVFLAQAPLPLFQVFLLVDEGTVERYKADLSDEVEPQITELISRAEKGLKALQKKQLLLQTKVLGIFCATLFSLLKQNLGRNSSIEAAIAVCAWWGEPTPADARKAT
jgi:hypothetical protein